MTDDTGADPGLAGPVRNPQHHAGTGVPELEPASPASPVKRTHRPAAGVWQVSYLKGCEPSLRPPGAPETPLYGKSGMRRPLSPSSRAVRARGRPAPASHGVRSRGQSQGPARHRMQVRRMRKAGRQTLPVPLATAGQSKGVVDMEPLLGACASVKQCRRRGRRPEAVRRTDHR